MVKFKELYRGAKAKFSRWGIEHFFGDQYTGPRGEIFMRLDHADGSVEEWHYDNVIVQDFSILLARLAKDPLEPRHGVFALAMGTGDTGWDLQNPPTETDTQRSLYNEIGRKTFVETDFIDDTSSAVAYPTNIVDFSTTFAESEVVGPLVEMALVGGDLNEDTSITNPITPANGPYDDTEDVSGKDLLVNYLTFPVINKPATGRLSIVWRISF